MGNFHRVAVTHSSHNRRSVGQPFSTAHSSGLLQAKFLLPGASRPRLSRFLPNSVGPSLKAASRFGSSSPCFGCPRKWDRKGDSKMPYLYVKWTSLGRGLPADVSVIRAWFVFRRPLPERRPAPPWAGRLGRSEGSGLRGRCCETQKPQNGFATA
jgi:hypothetical protein